MLRRAALCCGAPHYVATHGNKWQHAHSVQCRPSSQGCAVGPCVRVGGRVAVRAGALRVLSVPATLARLRGCPTSALLSPAMRRSEQASAAALTVLLIVQGRYRAPPCAPYSIEHASVAGEPEPQRCVPCVGPSPRGHKQCGRQVAALAPYERERGVRASVPVRVRGSESACTCERQKGPYPPPASPNMPTAAPAPASTQPAAPRRPAQPTAHRRARRISAQSKEARMHTGGAHGFQPSARMRACVRLPRRRCDTLRTPAHRCAATRSPARADAADNTPRCIRRACNRVHYY